MTQSDFREWISYHSSKFTGLAAWLDKLPSLGLSRDDVMASWFRTLSHCDLGSAKAATNLLGSDDHPEPRGWDRHPLAIASICRGKRKEDREREDRRGPKYAADGTPICKCQICQDWGVVHIYHPKTVNAFRRQPDLGRDRVTTAAARCSCNDTDHKDLLQYDAGQDLLAPVDYSTPEAIQRLREWCSIERRMADAEWTPSPLPIS